MSGKGVLFICPTPIGNLEDITLRTIRVLGEADIIAAEDTRRTRHLLNHLEIEKHLMSYHEHNKKKAGITIIEKLEEGLNIALVSDAGMPGISDPGEDLVRLCIERDIEIVCLPGPSALINALVVSGLPTNRFAFEGFLDRNKKKRRNRLEIIKNEDRTLVFYEAPHRLNDFFSDVKLILGDRQIVVARELTKRYEEFYRGTVSEAMAHFSEQGIKGEFVVLVEGLSTDERLKVEEEESHLHDMSIEEHLLMLMESGVTKKEAVKMVSKERKIPKTEVYKISIDL